MEGVHDVREETDSTQHEENGDDQLIGGDRVVVSVPYGRQSGQSKVRNDDHLGHVVDLAADFIQLIIAHHFELLAVLIVFVVFFVKVALKFSAVSGFLVKLVEAKSSNECILISFLSVGVDDLRNDPPEAANHVSNEGGDDHQPEDSERIHHNILRL